MREQVGHMEFGGPEYMSSLAAATVIYTAFSQVKQQFHLIDFTQRS